MQHVITLGDVLKVSGAVLLIVGIFFGACAIIAVLGSEWRH